MSENTKKLDMPTTDQLQKEVDRVQVLYGAAPVLPDAPAKRGYRFDGWEGVPETMPAQDVTVTARYIKA